MGFVENVQTNLEGGFRQYMEVIRGHDAVHPDRDECGGVGGCALLRAECDAEDVVLRRLKDVARFNSVYTVKVKVEES